jgi:hypothetical protein
VALAPVFGTYLLVYSKEFFSELLMALGVASPYGRSIAGDPTQAALALVLAIETRPQAAFLADCLGSTGRLLGSGSGSRRCPRVRRRPLQEPR